ncbi:MAG: type II toxin-antitoxin system HicB family antitoxin, partial [Burkholderiales bacterium]
MVSRYETLLATLRLDLDEHLDELDRCWWAMTLAEQEEVERRLGPGHAPPRMLEMSSKEGQVQVPEADRVYTAWVILSPAQDVPGTWVAHALDFDVVTQGSSAEDALRMGFEAVAIVLSDDLRDGRDPYRRRAPSECWAQLHELQE